MIIRHARIGDAQAICDLINGYAEEGRMLHRSLESVYDSLREFLVAVDDDDKVVGCVAVDIYWANLAEVCSLAVAEQQVGKGVGRKLIEAAVEDARKFDISRLFTLTYEHRFFENNGFRVIDRHTLPEKVWRVCVGCPKADACDEIAMIRELPPA